MTTETSNERHEAQQYAQKYLMCFVPGNFNLLHGVLRYLATEMEVYENKAVVLKTVEEGNRKRSDSRYVVIFRVNKDYAYNNAFSVTVGEKPFDFRLIQTNCKSKHLVYYTLNALNYLIAEEMDVDIEDVDRNHQVDWASYERSVIYCSTYERAGVVYDELRVVPTSLVGAINLQPTFSTNERDEGEEEYEEAAAE